MLDKNSKLGINCSSRIWLVIMGFGLTSVASLGAFSLFHHMDILTFIASLNTKQVTVAQLQQGKLKPVILIDVRSPEEYAEDRIGESRLVPLTDIELGFGVKQVQSILKARVKSDRPQPIIVLYCARGGRSVKAYKQLEKIAQYSQDVPGNETNKINDVRLNVVVLSGGIKAWRQAVPAQKDAEILAPITVRSLIKSPSVTLMNGMNRGSCDQIDFCQISTNRKVYRAGRLAIFKKSSHNPQQSATVGCFGRQHNNQSQTNLIPCKTPQNYSQKQTRRVFPKSNQQTQITKLSSSNLSSC